MAWGDDAWGENEWGGRKSTINLRLTGAYGASTTYNGDRYTGQPLTSQVQVPAAPFNLAAVRYTEPLVSISWTAGANAVTFEIQRSPDGVTWASLATGIVPSVYLDTSTTWGTTYSYQVRATNVAGAGPWSATLTVIIPNGDDGDWLYLDADVVPTLVESGGDWLYLNADVIPTLVETGGDWLYLNTFVWFAESEGDYLYLYANNAPSLVESDSDYLYLYANNAPLLVESGGDYLYVYAYNEPSTLPVGLLMGSPPGTLYLYGTAPPAGFIILTTGQPVLLLTASPSDVAIGAPPGNAAQAAYLEAGNILIGSPSGLTQAPPTMPLFVYQNVGFQTNLSTEMFLQSYENVGFQVALLATMFIEAYENIGFGPAIGSQPAIYVGAVYMAQKIVSSINQMRMNLYAYENIGFLLELSPDAFIYSYEDVLLAPTGYCLTTLQDLAIPFGSIFYAGEQLAISGSYVYKSSSGAVDRVNTTTWIMEPGWATGDIYQGYLAGPDPSGNLYGVSTDRVSIQKIDPSGVVSTLVGVPGVITTGFSGSLSMGRNGDLVVTLADSGICTVTTGGIVTRITALDITSDENYDFCAMDSTGSIWVTLDNPPSSSPNNNVNTTLRHYVPGSGITEVPIQALVDEPADGGTEAYGGIYCDSDDYLIVLMVTNATSPTSSWFLRVAPDGSSVERIAGTWGTVGSPAPVITSTNIADGPLGTSLACQIGQGAGITSDGKTIYFIDDSDQNGGTHGNLLRKLAKCP